MDYYYGTGCPERYRDGVTCDICHKKIYKYEMKDGKESFAEGAYHCSVPGCDGDFHVSCGLKSEIPK